MLVTSPSLGGLRYKKQPHLSRLSLRLPMQLMLYTKRRDLLRGSTEFHRLSLEARSLAVDFLQLMLP